MIFEISEISSRVNDIILDLILELALVQAIQLAQMVDRSDLVVVLHL